VTVAGGALPGSWAACLPDWEPRARAGDSCTIGAIPGEGFDLEGVAGTRALVEGGERACG